MLFFLFPPFFFSHFFVPASGQAVVTGVVPPPPRFLPSIFIAHRADQSHCSSLFHRVLLTHALALSASQFVHKKKSQRIYTSMHSAGLELTKVTYTRLEDNLIRHRGDRLYIVTPIPRPWGCPSGYTFSLGRSQHWVGYIELFRVYELRTIFRRSSTYYQVLVLVLARRVLGWRMENCVCGPNGVRQYCSSRVKGSRDWLSCFLASC